MVALKPSTEMNILWLAKEACEGYVEYGPTPAPGNRAENYDSIPENNPGLEVYPLTADLKDPEPGSVVYYRVTTVLNGEAHPSNRYFFKTAPEEGGEFDFALLSDMQLKGAQASVEDNGIGYIGRLFDIFIIAE